MTFHTNFQYYLQTLNCISTVHRQEGKKVQKLSNLDKGTALYPIYLHRVHIISRKKPLCF